MAQWRALTPYMQRYMVRVMLFMSAYVVILVSSLMFARNGTPHSQATLIGLALAEQANRITLYKVLGGRWIDTTPGDSTATPGT